MRLPKGNPGYIKQKADTHEIPLFSYEVKYKHNIQALNEINQALLFTRTISLKVPPKIIKTHFWLGLRGRKVIFFFFSKSALQFSSKTSDVVDSLRDILRGSLAPKKKEVFPYHPNAEKYADPQELKKNIH